MKPKDPFDQLAETIERAEQFEIKSTPPSGQGFDWAGARLPMVALCLDCEWEGFADDCPEREIRIDRKISICPRCKSEGVILEPVETLREEVRLHWWNFLRELAKVWPVKQTLDGLLRLCNWHEARKQAKRIAWRTDWVGFKFSSTLLTYAALDYIAQRCDNENEANVIVHLVEVTGFPASQIVANFEDFRRMAENPDFPA